MDAPAEEDIVVRGAARIVAWARDAAGRRLAKEFVEREVAPRERTRLMHWFQALADRGRIANRRMFRKEVGEIWAFKSGEIRIAAFREGPVWFLTHGFIKKSDRWPTQELRRAERIRLEHQERGRAHG